MLFVDDRGEALEEQVELCWLESLERTCIEVAPGETPVPPESFEVLTVEGPRHGPKTLRRQALPGVEGNGSHRVVVPRKAQVLPRGLPEDESVQLSFYDAHDPVFRQPFVRVRAREEGHWVRAGLALISLAAPRTAPDLHLLHLQPGERRSLQYRQRDGWSLLVRTVDRESTEPVAGARIVLEPTAGYGSPGAAGRAPESAPDVELSTNRAGLAVKSGLQQPLVDAEISHSGFLDSRIPAISSSPGTFAFREHALPRGGSLLAQIRVDGEAAVGLSWELLEYRRETPDSTEPPKTLDSGETGEDGVLTTRRVPEGSYFLGLFPRGPTGPRVDRSIQIVEGEVSEAQVALEPIPLDGRVFRGGRGVEGIDILVHSQDDRKPNAVASDAVATATTGEDGEYEAILWLPGRYSVHATLPDGTPGDVEIVDLGSAGDTVNFYFGPHDIEGVVVDGEGRPVAGAHVLLIWAANYYRRGVSGENGRFAFPIEDESGTAVLRAQKVGYQRSEDVEIQYIPGEPPPAVTLTLGGGEKEEGRLLAAGGAPVVGGWVATYRVDGVGEPQLVDLVRTDSEGAFRIPTIHGAKARLYFGGPGCPLGFQELPAEGVGPPSGAGGMAIRCSPSPANLDLQMVDTEGAPAPGTGVLLARDRVVIPLQVLGSHLAGLGLSPMADSRGRLLIPALEPGTYSIFLATQANAFTIARGLGHGFLGRARLEPFSTATAHIVLEQTSP